MKVIILAAGITKKEYFKIYDAPKCIIPLKDDRTSLDLQMERLSKYNFPVTIIVGYKGNEVIDFCKRRGYDVEFAWDNNYDKEYSVTRILKEMKHLFEGNIIILYADTLFREDLLEKLLSCNADICKSSNTFKMTTKGMAAIIDILEHKDFEGLNSPLFFGVQEEYPDITVNKTITAWQFDIDRIEELVTARAMAKSLL